MPSPNAPAASRSAAASAVLELRLRPHDAHPAAAAARCGLDEERETDLLGGAVGEDRHPGLARDPLRRELVSAEAKRLRRRPDPGQVRGLHRFREVAVLGQEAVPRVDRVGAALLRRADVLLRLEVARDLDRGVGTARVQRPAVVGRNHGDGLDPEGTARAEDPHRDLSSVRDEQPADRHGPHSMPRPRAAIRSAP